MQGAKEAMRAPTSRLDLRAPLNLVHKASSPTPTPLGLDALYTGFSGAVFERTRQSMQDSGLCFQVKVVQFSILPLLRSTADGGGLVPTTFSTPTVVEGGSEGGADAGPVDGWRGRLGG